MITEVFPREARNAALHAQIAEELKPDKNVNSILDSLADPQTSLEYAAKFLRFLSEYRDYGDNFALWLSDYNRGLTSEEDPNDYGKRFNTYRKNIQYVLNWQVTPPYWVPKPGMDLDQILLWRTAMTVSIEKVAKVGRLVGTCCM